MTSPTSSPPITLDPFAYRQFDNPTHSGTKIPIPQQDFMDAVLDYYNKRQSVADEYRDAPVLIDGYAPFCKHVFMPNFIDGVRDDAIEITKENEHLIRTKYEARKEGELPVLRRFFPKGKVEAPESAYLDLICKLYACCGAQGFTRQHDCAKNH